jgi:hypothetical protein
MSEPIEVCDICYEDIPSDAPIEVVESAPGEKDGVACAECFVRLVSEGTIGAQSEPQASEESTS